MTDANLNIHHEEIQWEAWRGSKELLAHVFTAAQWWISKRTEQQAPCLIDIRVGDDHELFTSPDDFSSHVTLEALRHFSDINAEIGTNELRATIEMRWRRPWWKPGRGGDAEVQLRVQGHDRSDVELVHARLRAALLRARVDVGMLLFVAGSIIGTIGVGTVGMALFLLEQSEGVVLRGMGVAVIIIGVAGSVWISWIYRTLEVAPYRQSNLWRFVKVGGPVVLTILVSGLTKALYG